MLVTYTCDDDLNYEAVVVLDPDSGDTLSIQRSLHPDEQDIALGMDTYCVTRGAASHYGGIESWAMRDSTIQLTLSQSGAAALELPTSLEIEVTAPDLDDVRSHLARIMT